METMDLELDHRRRRGVSKRKRGACVRQKRARGMSLTKARRACGVKAR